MKKEIATSARVTPLTCSGHTRPVTYLHFAGEVFISACKDGNPMLRDGTTGDWIGTFLGHKGSTWSAKLSRDAEKAVTGSADFSAKVWDTFTGQVLQSYSHDHIVRSVAFNSDASMICTGGYEKKVRIFDTRSNSATHEFLGHEGNIKSVVWDSRPEAQDNIVISAADDKTVRYWDIRAQKQIDSWTAPANITSLEQGQQFLTVTAGQTIHFIDPASHEIRKKITTDYDVSSVSLNPEGTRFITGGTTELWVRVYDYEAAKELEVYKGHHGPIHTVSYSPDGGLYATGSEDGTIRLWKAASGPYGLWN
ncbi:WD repeat protein [Taphrina deformans PYCC 5710]|uniref:Serine-threonine kinase receptor-associated protein n=1 Tax=Taphrina deformans (strain PYCC 5710 / ATCC 11124 / CBS 356.35 / IMI 108563 / JCM 9778 / NBRC 8474) TaxID=1097556 RepID=R4X9C1_TAPDE|nr:WD repeat protein [Taphrina deformans PYCC 5710]|eukprot:CCG82326.1 WD repeat protein [Taphrina deformans PYCC 5710]